MKQAGGKGRIGLWVLAFRNPIDAKGGSFDLDAGAMLSVAWGSSVLLSIGIRGIGTIGIGWVTKRQREQDALMAAHIAEHEALHEQGIDHEHP
jgi:hypothetical protein